MNSWTAPLRRHPLAAGLGAFLLLLAVVFAVCEWRGWPFLRGPLERTLSQRLDREFRLGEAFELKLLGSLRVSSDRLSVGPPRWAPQEGEARFFQAEDVALAVPWSTLWNVVVAKRPEPLRIANLEVGHFDAALWRRGDGRANWEFRLPQQDDTAPRTQPEFQRLVVRSGRLSLVDVPNRLRLHAQAQTAEGRDAGPDRGLRIRGDGRYREGDFDFTMRTDGVLPLVAGQGDDLAVRLTMNARTPDGRVKFDGQARDVIHLQALQGRFEVDGRSLAEVAEPFGITLPTTAQFEARGQLAKDGEVWRAVFDRFDVGSSRLAGDFRFDRRPARPVLTGSLRGRNLDLLDLAPAFGNPAPGSGNPPKGGRLFPEREFDIPSLQRMDADVRVELQRADLHTAKLEPFTPLKGRVGLKNGVLRIDDLQASTAGGRIQGFLQLDGRQPKAPVWAGDLRIAGVSLEQWLNVRNPRSDDPKAAAAQGNTTAPTYVSGRLGGQLKFTGRGDSIAEMVSSLDGSITAWINEGRLSHLALEAAGIDIAQALGVLVRGDQGLAMQCAATQFAARDGELRMTVGIIDTRDTTMLFEGGLSLDKERFALTARAYPKDFSLASLRTPVHVEGPLLKPQVRLEKKPLALKAGAAVVLGAVVNPLAALLPLIDPGQDAPVACQDALAALQGGVRRGTDAPRVQAAGTEGARGSDRGAARQGGRQAAARDPAPSAAGAGPTVGEQPTVPTR